jgi:hypothetical protein
MAAPRGQGAGRPTTTQAMETGTRGPATSHVDGTRRPFDHHHRHRFHRFIAFYSFFGYDPYFYSFYPYGYYDYYPYVYYGDYCDPDSPYYDPARLSIYNGQYVCCDPDSRYYDARYCEDPSRY